jgi:ABC-type protease/lipase transport system fused ATPase/permease subunit
MNWLFGPQLRPIVLWAGGLSLLLNLALLVPALCTVQVFERVFASRSGDTLAVLSLAAVVALAFGFCMDMLRSRASAGAGRLLEAGLSPALMRQPLAQASAPGRRADSDAMHDVGKLRGLLGGSAALAVFDAPWVPIHLLVGVETVEPVFATGAARTAIRAAMPASAPVDGRPR